MTFPSVLSAFPWKMIQLTIRQKSIIGVEIPSDCTLQSPISLVLFDPKAAGTMVFQDGISFLRLIEKIF